MTESSPTTNRRNEPDWASLNDINFLLYNRFAHPLNAALSAIELSESPDTTGFSAEWWRNRAKDKIASTLSIVMAWSWLIQYKNGMALPRQAIRPVSLDETIQWLSQKLKMSERDSAELTSIMLSANQETLYEALLLLYSVALSQGSGVKVSWDAYLDRVNFTIGFKRRNEIAPISDIERLIQSFKSHWRSQLTAFELRLAQNFLELNNIDLTFEDSGDRAQFRFTIARMPDQVKQIVSVKEDGKVGPEKPTEEFLSMADPTLHSDTDTIVLQSSVELDDSSEIWSDETRVKTLRTAQAAPPPSEALSEWRSFMEYESVDWESVGFINKYAYQRLTNPVIKALGHLDTIRHSNGQGDVRELSVNNAERHLEMLIVSMKSLAVLTRWKVTHEIDVPDRPIKPHEIPPWLKTTLGQHTTLDFKHTMGLLVNSDTLYEALLLITNVTRNIGTLEQIILRDAKNGKGVWLRFIFVPPKDRRYKSKLDVLDSFVRSNPMGEDLATQFSVADDLFKANGTKMVLQENMKTNQQAFAVLLPAKSLETPPAEAPEASEKKKTDKKKTAKVPMIKADDTNGP
ncbi:MAG: hypothetical protein L0154_18375 [Chloroflexi bacterium]|nr:hypothetical protein [Chloroflexota bacterium]